MTGTTGGGGWSKVRSLAAGLLGVNSRLRGVLGPGARIGLPLLVSLGPLVWASPGEGPTVDPPRPVLASTPGYVALGDSYSAGEGLTPYLAGTGDLDDGGNRCHRSAKSYAVLLGGTDLVDGGRFVACSGAVVAEVTAAPQRHVDRNGVPRAVADEPQAVLVGGPADRKVEVVTVTIGGNDAGFADILGRCARRFGCLDEEWQPPPVRREAGDRATPWATAWEGPLEDRLVQETEVQRESLAALYGDLGGRWPDARILVIGYPALLSADVGPSGSDYCGRGFVGLFSVDEREGLALAEERLNSVIEEEALAAGLEYVHTADAFDGHEVCGPDGQWIDIGNLKVVGESMLRDWWDDGDLNLGVPAGWFHPTPDGQAMIAQLVRCYLEVHPERPRSADEPGAVGRTGDDVHACAQRAVDDRG